MTREEIEQAVEKARAGVEKYLAIMDRVCRVNVSEDPEFKRLYNGFYKVRNRAHAWYQSYYTLLESLKDEKTRTGVAPTFAHVLDVLKERTARCEASFSSKLVATLDPDKPIWDVYVLANTSHKAPSSQNPHRFELAKAAYRSIEEWYKEFIPSDEGKLCIAIFNEKIADYRKISDTKKVDFILWQIRKKPKRGR